MGCFDDNTRLEPSISEQLARNAQALRRQAYSAQTLHQLKISKYVSIKSVNFTAFGQGTAWGCGDRSGGGGG